MQITIELRNGRQRFRHVTKSDIQNNIDALKRYRDEKETIRDLVLMTDSISILEAIKDRLPSA